jgi:hypothetical protein
MAGYVLDAGVTITCPHGARAVATPRATRVNLDKKPPLLADDVMTIAGCPFVVGVVPSPCMRVQWIMPATRMMIESSAPLLSSSVGLCLNAAGAPQGTAIVSGYQTRVQGT